MPELWNLLVVMFHFSEEKNQYLAERCNRLSKAIFKRDELSENLHQLAGLAKEQRDTMQLLKIKCKEMVDNIEKSKWHSVFLFGIALHSLKQL